MGSRSDHTFLPETYVELIARKLTARDAERLSVGSMVELAAVHRRRGELLSAAQYEALIEERREVDVGVVQGG